jgi:glycosyltransferase involved in cell wall biosynthesis
MPSYNSEAYVHEAIESILRQTVGDFEFVIVDDGSTDETARIVEAYAKQDKRIRFFPLEHQGYVKMLRLGLEKCRAPFVARMDSDDISMPHRFAKQLDYLRKHPECVCIGSRILLIDPYGSPIETPDHKLQHEQIDAELLRGIGWGVVHPVTVMRRDVVMEVGGYREDLAVSEDLDLFLKLAERGRLANLPDVLLKYRQHLKSVNYTQYELQKKVKRGIVADAHVRRGLKMPENWTLPQRKVLSASAQYRRWGWAALRTGNFHIARRHALAALQRAPLSIDSWRLTACAVRGY